jgi:ribosomal RNA methyltransferase Nop2
MRKQGIPEPLDESLVTRKRKDAPAKEVEDRGKKRRTEAKAVKPVKTANGSKTKGKGKPSKKVAPPPVDEDEISSEADISDDADGIDDPDVMEDPLEGVNVTGLDALGSASESEELDGDEFGDSDSDVMDSDTEVRKVGMWSDDEDESDVEEKLTAANIEGLSRKRDMEQAIRDAEAAAEEAEMQTNIAGERPKVLEDEDEAERPISNLAAQDLQLLRTRLSDTIRVLDDFKNLAEKGRSRTEYRAQMLKDICGKIYP